MFILTVGSGLGKGLGFGDCSCSQTCPFLDIIHPLMFHHCPTLPSPFTLPALSFVLSTLPHSLSPISPTSLNSCLRGGSTLPMHFLRSAEIRCRAVEAAQPESGPRSLVTEPWMQPTSCIPAQPPSLGLHTHWPTPPNSSLLEPPLHQPH